MIKSYIIRIYVQENETASGVVVDIEKNKHFGFSNAKQLWSLITNTRQEHQTDNVIKQESFNTNSRMLAEQEKKTY